MLGIIGIIVGAIIASIIGIAAIWALVAILELFKIVALGVLIPLTFLWLWGFLIKSFKLDEYISAGLAILMTSFIAIWVYHSWWAIVVLGVVVIILYSVYKIVMRTGILDLVKEIAKKRYEG